MFLVVAVVLLGLYFFADVMPLWFWVPVASAAVWLWLCEPIENVCRSWRPRSREIDSHMAQNSHR